MRRLTLVVTVGDASCAGAQHALGRNMRRGATRAYAMVNSPYMPFEKSSPSGESLSPEMLA
jgi:hypothetical protein